MPASAVYLVGILGQVILIRKERAYAPQHEDTFPSVYYCQFVLRHQLPAINCGDESTFDSCSKGIEEDSVVAAPTYMASEHNNRCDQKERFKAGYNEMLRRIEPEKIICYNTPFPEMQGNIIYVGYECSFWGYMNYERGFQKEDLESFKIGGSFYTNHDTIEPFLIGKGATVHTVGNESPPNQPMKNLLVNRVK